MNKDIPTRKAKLKNGFILSETLIALTISAVVILICIIGISSAFHFAEASAIKSTADSLAESTALYIKNEIRFAENPNETVDALSSLEPELNGMRLRNLSFITADDGSVTFRFNVAKYNYEYTVYPLNQRFVPTETDSGF